MPKPRTKRELVPNAIQSVNNVTDTGYGTVAEENCLSMDCTPEYYGIDSDLTEMKRLQELKEKHGENKKKADAIKKSLGLKSNY